MLAGIEAAAEAWGADWQRADGRIALPVSAGLHRGSVVGRLSIEPAAAGCRLVLAVEERRWHLRGNAVALLLLAAAGGLAVILWPFFPSLLPLVPVGLLLSVSAWFLIVSRLTTASPQDFLSLAAELAASPPEEGEDPAR